MIHNTPIMWAFAYKIHDEYIITMVAENRRYKLIKHIEDMDHKKWAQIRREGGVALKCKMTPVGR